MIEILMLLGAIAIWFTMGAVSSCIAFYMIGRKFGNCKYNLINNTGRKRGIKRTLALLLIMGPFMGVLAYYVICALIEMHQGKIYLEEV